MTGAHALGRGFHYMEVTKAVNELELKGTKKNLIENGNGQGPKME